MFVCIVNVNAINTNKHFKRSQTVALFAMELHKLNNIQQVLEKFVFSTSGHLKNVQYHQDITDFSDKLNDDRQKETETLREKIKETLNMLKHKSDTLKGNKIPDITDFKQFKREMISIQENIQNLRTKAKLRLGQLTKEYAEIAEEVDYYSELVPRWSEATKDHNFAFSIKKSQSLKGPTCKATKDFIDFVHKSNGHENGWRKEDHQLFLRYRKKFKTADAIARELHETLPDLSVEEIKLHEEWYKRYLDLRRKKKDAIKAWKKSKSRNKKRFSEDAEVDQPKICKQQKPQDIRQQLSEWKLEKEQQQIQIAREMEQAQEQRRKELEAQQQKRTEELRKLVQDWKKTKTALVQQETERKKWSAEKEKRRRATEANKMIKQFQSQDDLYIAKMLKQRKEAEVPKPARSKSSQLAKRDPDRLLKPTEQWINRVHDDKIYPSERSNLPLKNLPKLSVPEWRKKVQ